MERHDRQDQVLFYLVGGDWGEKRGKKTDLLGPAKSGETMRSK
jgi:hypothetical protein